MFGLWETHPTTNKGNEMQNRIEELEGYIARALELRKRGYQINIGRQFIWNINSDLRTWQTELAQLKAGK